ncbi:MAG: type 2 isopentenyl-diphosphate Delta-isomerase [Bdellovibrionaceae bacterium]|nr:type 2 isopentenyl-diphosphate Delta-isomerase [Pseudobdellovibrionaceae bacterium]MBX3033510.1 type 2 isopentenyl-diphosphate Delta-isomerase [Pseudobdellovibrionaceae bacterium]
MADLNSEFEKRKRDHIRIALDPRAQSSVTSGFDAVELVHEALPDLDFQDIDSSWSFQGHALSAPYFISSMTAGHDQGRDLNRHLARLAQERRLLMGVGSQRRELSDPGAAEEWRQIRREAPRAVLLGNLGLAQLIRTPGDQVKALVDNLQAAALFIHLNPLQECLQPEGTPQFRGGLKAIERLVKELPVPVIVKETGSGFSAATLRRLDGAGIHAVDVSGLGGTHWGRVETQRLEESDFRSQAGTAFADWGVRTVESLLHAKEVRVSYQLWASGGVRNGLDVAKSIALGAQAVGLAQPWLRAAMEADPERALHRLADRLDYELKVSLFCTGQRTPAELRATGRWTWRNS